MRFLPLMCCVLLTACSLALPGPADKPAPAAANPITGSAITTTAITPEQKTAQPATKPTPTAPPPAAEPPKREVATAIASPEQLACIKKGGAWRKAGKSGAESCFKMTKDAGKSCSREGDCDGFCLARSRTCAPIKPMFGCNEILQDNGAMVTLCID